MESGTKVNIYKNITILYEDNHLIVCIKPEGILSQKDDTDEADMLTVLKEYLKVTYNKQGNVYLGLVHRLDRRVSGVMVFAKTSKAASRLSSEIRENTIKKTYYAVASGAINGSGRLENKLAKVNERAVETNDGKTAILDYEVLKSFKINNKDYTLLKVLLHTGRFNQIRAQFSLFNHPLINDYKYGYSIKDNSNDYSHIGLFCVELSFIHPVTKELLTFTYDEVINRTIEDWINFFMNGVSKYEK